MENKKAPYLFLGILIVLSFMVLIFIKVNHNLNPSPEYYHEVSPSANLALDFNQAGIYLFTTSGCPYCAHVNEYLTQTPEVSRTHNLITISLDHLSTHELYQQELTKFAQICQLDTQTINIPFVYINDDNLTEESRCLSGDLAIIDYLTHKAN